MDGITRIEGLPEGAAKKKGGGNGGNGAATQPPFKFKPLAELRRTLHGAQYLVKPFLERDAVFLVFGESGAHKTFWVLDIALSVSADIGYHGFKVNQGAVFYICGEGHGGIGRRCEAWCRHHRVDGDTLPFFVSEIPAQLIERGDCEAIGLIVRQLAERHGVEPVLIVIDTLSANLGAGDENSNADMARLLQNAAVYLRNPTGACVLFVHHVGHGDKTRERGAYALRGNTDARIRIELDEATGQVSAHSVKVKDGEPWPPAAYTPERVPLPDVLDSEGEGSGSLVLVMADYAPPAQQRDEKKSGAMKLLLELFAEHRERIGKGKLKVAPRVSRKEWRDEALGRGVYSHRNNFNTAVRDLIKVGGVRLDEAGFCWPAGMADDSADESDI